MHLADVYFLFFITIVFANVSKLIAEMIADKEDDEWHE